MKTRIIFILASLLIGIACSKSDDENGNNPDKPNKPSPLPDLPDPDDICSCMDDITFMQYCYDNFDANKDGKVSKIEANAVVEINIERDGLRSLKGIGYFPNLQILTCKEQTGLVSVDLSNNSKITSMGFYDCSNLTSIVLPKSITSIGERAFIGCSSLTSIVIPESVTSIGNDAFAYCSSLTSIVLPEGVTSIGNNAFYGCSNLTSIYCKPTTPPLIMGGFNVEFILYVPAQCIEAYKNSQWSRYYSSIEAIK